MAFLDLAVAIMTVLGAAAFFVLRAIGKRKRRTQGCCDEPGSGCENCGGH
jgi:hypothetical protein